MSLTRTSSASHGRDAALRLDRLPWKPLHTRITLALGIGWLLDSFEVNVIGNILGLLQKLWHLTTIEASLLVSVWLGGIMLGAVLFGWLTDRFGRRRLFTLTLLFYSACTLLCALAPGYPVFLLFRFLTALGVGAEYSAVNAAIGELIPARYRGRINGLVMNFWPLGAIVAAGASFVLLNLLPAWLGWRLAFGLGALLAVFILWARRVLPESPRWLAQRGDVRAAHAVLEQMEAGEGNFHDAPAVSAPTGRIFRELLTEWRGRVALGAALDFSEAAGYYGLFAFLPLVVLPRVGIGLAAVPRVFLLGNLGAVLGGALAALLLDACGRKLTVTGFYLLAAASMLGMGAALDSGSAGGVTFAFAIANFCATGSWVSAYPTFTELFPSHLRATGVGLCVAIGRIGAALAPPLLVWMAGRASVHAAFLTLAAFWLLGALAMLPWCLRGIEGRRQPLETLTGEAVQ